MEVECCHFVLLKTQTAVVRLSCQKYVGPPGGKTVAKYLFERIL